MNYQVKTVYNADVLTSMAKAERMTIRKKESKRAHTLALVVVGAAIVLEVSSCLFSRQSWQNFNWLMVVLGLVLVAVVMNEDQLNGKLASRKLPKERKESVVTFGPEGYTVETQAETSEWKYESVRRVCEMENCYLFLTDRNNGQVLDKKGFLQGDPEQFRDFAAEKTGKPVEYIK